MSKIFFIDDLILKFQCPSTDERIKDVVYLYNGILLSHKKNEIMPFPTTWMDLETIILSEVNQSEATQSCPTLGDPVDCSPPGSSIHGILQARYWSGLPFPSPRNLSDPAIEFLSLAGFFYHSLRQILYHWATGEAWYMYVCRYNSIAKFFFLFLTNLTTPVLII